MKFNEESHVFKKIEIKQSTAYNPIDLSREGELWLVLRTYYRWVRNLLVLEELWVKAT